MRALIKAVVMEKKKKKSDIYEILEVEFIWPDECFDVGGKGKKRN